MKISVDYGSCSFLKSTFNDILMKKILRLLIYNFNDAVQYKLVTLSDSSLLVIS